MRGLIAGLGVALAAGPVAACLNDSELPSHEREFRSQYRDGYDPFAPPKSQSEVFLHTALYSSGAVLLVGAAGLALTRRRAEV
jgi:hypothetical protein